MTEKTFQQVMQEFMNRYGNKDYAEALDLLNQEQERFPAQAPQFYYNRACMLGVQKRVPETLAVLREADERGFFFDADTMHKDTDFESLLGNPEFEKLVESFQTRHAQRQGQVSSSRLVVEPPGVAQASSVPLLLVLHGNGSSAAASEPYWKPAAAAGWLVGLVQSSQLGFSESAFVWNDEVRSLQDIETQLAEINKAYPVDPKRVIVGGFSMGGGIAALLGLTQPFPARGFIGVGAFMAGKLDEWMPHIAAARERGTRATLIVGDQDQGCYPDTVRLAELLKNCDVPCELKVYPGMGHTNPPDFDTVLVEALNFITA